MLCLRCVHGPASTSAMKPSSLARLIEVSGSRTSRRTLTYFTSPLRPTTQLSSSPFQASPRFPARSPPGPNSTAVALDLLPKMSAHPALATTQIRCGPRDTFSPSHFVRKRRHGFLSRVRTRKGRALLQRRRTKRRSTLSH